MIMGRLINQELRSMNDPAGVVSRIRAVSSEENRRQTLRLLEAAKDSWIGPTTSIRFPAARATTGVHMHDVFGTSFPWPTW